MTIVFFPFLFIPSSIDRRRKEVTIFGTSIFCSRYLQGTRIVNTDRSRKKNTSWIWSNCATTATSCRNGRPSNELQSAWILLFISLPRRLLLPDLPRTRLHHPPEAKKVKEEEEEEEEVKEAECSNREEKREEEKLREDLRELQYARGGWVV